MHSFRKILPYLALTGANLIWGFTFMMQRIGMETEGSTPPLMMAARFFVALITISVFLLVRGIRPALKGRDIKGIFFLMSAECVYFIFEIYGIFYTNSSFAGLLLAVVPVFSIGLAAVWLREFPGWKKAFFCLIPIAGVIMITLSGSSLGFVRPVGVLLLALACLTSAFDKTVNRKIAGEFSPLERTFWMMLACFLFFTVFGLGNVSWDIGAFLAPWQEPRFLVSVLLMGIFSSTVAGILINYAACHLPVMHLSVFGAVSTVFSTFAGVFFLHEPLTAVMAAGVVLIIFGVLIVSLPPASAKEPSGQSPGRS